MALTNIEEPYVKVTERIREYPTLLNTTGTSNRGGVIVAPTGPRISFVTGPQDFLDKYTVDGNIPRNADITFLNAYYLSFSSSLVLVRSMDTEATGGILFTSESINKFPIDIQSDDWSISLDAKLYELEPYYLIVKIDGSDDQYYTNMKYDARQFADFATLFLDSDLPNGVVNNYKLIDDGTNEYILVKKSYLGESTPTSPFPQNDPNFGKGQLTNIEFGVATSDTDPTWECEVWKFQLTYTEADNYSAFFPYFTKGSTTPGLIISSRFDGSPVTLIVDRTPEQILGIEEEENGFHIISENPFKASYIGDDESPIDTVDTCNKTESTTQKVLSVETGYPNFESAVTEYNSILGTDYIYQDGSISTEDSVIFTAANVHPSGFSWDGPYSGAIKFNSKNVIFKDKLLLDQTQTLDVAVQSNKWGFVVNDLAFVYGPVNLSNYQEYSVNKISKTENSFNWSEIKSSLNNLPGVSCIIETNDELSVRFKLKVAKGYSVDPQAVFGKEDHTTASMSTAQDDPEIPTNYDFRAVYTTPSNKDDVKLVIGSKSGNTFDLTVSVKTTLTTQQVSLDPDAVDANGSNCFIENLNGYGLGVEFYMRDINDPSYSSGYPTPDVMDTYAFGNSGLNLAESKTPAAKIKALRYLEDQDLYDIEDLATFGETDLSFLKNFTLIGKRNDWFTPIDIPLEKMDTYSIKNFFRYIDDSSNIIAMGPFDKNSALVGWSFKVACTTLYYEKIAINRSGKSEFAPMFDQANGILNFKNPFYLLSKSERIDLLNAKCPINFTVYNQRNDCYYLNDNRTHQSKNDIVSEEQNRRMVNKIKKDCKRLLQTYKGRLNTTTTRRNVEGAIKYYFQTQVMNQNYRPNDFQVICNETNNTLDLIQANKLAVTVRVRLENSIKYIDVLVDVFPLGVDFEE